MYKGGQGNCVDNSRRHQDVNMGQRSDQEIHYEIDCDKNRDGKHTQAKGKDDR